MFARFTKSLRAYSARRKTANMLRRMEDHQLRDIGLERGNIDLVVRRGQLTF